MIRIPKNLSFFEDLLCQITPHLHAQSKVICGAMVKHLAKGAFDLLNQYIGPTTTSLAQKKARLVFADFRADFPANLQSDFQKKPISSPYPIQLKIALADDDQNTPLHFDLPFVNHSNLFSREKLDIGTRFFLDHLPQGNFKTILDLGCANGIIGIAAKKLNPSAKIIFSDESSMAIQSAETNYRNYFPEDSPELCWTNCYENQTPQSLDLVLCNPPFHQGTTLGDFIAWQMFKDAHHALTNGGTLRVIGNSHLHYPAALKKIFGNSQVISKNAKFTITEAVKNR